MGRDSKSRFFLAVGSGLFSALILLGVPACGGGDSTGKIVAGDGGGGASVGGSGGNHPEDGGAGTTVLPGDDAGGGAGGNGNGGAGIDGSGGAGPVGSGGAVAIPDPWIDLTEPAISVVGGSAPTQDGVGREGGTIHVVSEGAIAHDPAVAPAAVPAGPAAGGDVLTSQALAADVTRDGTIHVTGDVASGGAEAVRSITSSAGDIIIDGVLRAAPAGTSMQGFVIKAPGGTVFISGAVEAGGVTRGSAGGAISISARRIVVTGRIATRGGDGDGATAAGAAGSITLTAAELVVVAGSIDASGGNAFEAGNGKAVAGRGGDLTLRAADVQLQGHIRIRGGVANSGGAEAEGGAAATLRIDADNAAQLAGTVDARGGSARAATAGGTVTGGAGGTVSIGSVKPPQSIAITVPLALIGGAGDRLGGKGGTLTLEARGGDLRLGGNVDVGGGNARKAAGAAGAVNGQAGPAAGGILVAGKLAGRGGSVESGGAGDGGLGATVMLTVISVSGPLQVQAAAEIACDGGGSGGPGLAGGGGRVDLLTYDGNISMAGHLSTRGGTARDPGGAGGLGGQVSIFSDNNTNGVGGNLTVETSGVIDASGGAGTIGGHARNNGGGGVALFPDLRGQIAVLLNSDGIHGSPKNGELQNLGKVIARGAPGDGWGGDVIYHGRQPGNNKDPAPGHVEMDADGAGQPGEYVAE